MDPAPGPQQEARGDPQLRKDSMRILVVEDEFLVALQLEEDLHAAGYAIVGPFNNVAAALPKIREGEFDIAVLDINLGDEMVFPLADELAARQKPFIFLTGYEASGLPERYRSFPRIRKPHEIHTLTAEIKRVAASARHHRR